jgi:hypothetical protein
MLGSKKINRLKAVSPWPPEPSKEKEIYHG